MCMYVIIYDMYDCFNQEGNYNDLHTAHLTVIGISYLSNQSWWRKPDISSCVANFILFFLIFPIYFGSATDLSPNTSNISDTRFYVWWLDDITGKDRFMDRLNSSSCSRCRSCWRSDLQDSQAGRGRGRPIGPRLQTWRPTAAELQLRLGREATCVWAQRPSLCLEKKQTVIHWKHTAKWGYSLSSSDDDDEEEFLWDSSAQGFYLVLPTTCSYGGFFWGCWRVWWWR